MAFRDVLTIVSTLAIGFFCGWLIGSRKEVKSVENVRYTCQPTTEIASLFPKWESSKPIELPMLQYRDTIREEVHIPADTASIIADYLQRREYNLDFSTDSTGVYKVRAVVEANRLASATATITPLVREVERVTEVQPRMFRPYIGGGVGIGKNISASLEVGALLKNKHLPRLGYMRVGKDNYITASYGYCF